MGVSSWREKKKKRDKRIKILELVTVLKTEQWFSPGARAAHQHNVGDEIYGTKMTMK